MVRLKNKKCRGLRTTVTDIDGEKKRGFGPRFTGNVRWRTDLSIARKRELYAMMVVPLLLISVLLSCTSGPGYQIPNVKGDTVMIDVSQLKAEKPEFFSLTRDDRTIEFFVVKTGTAVESYINACRKCYLHKKGFRQDGRHLVCRYCNVRYPLHTLKTGIGSCSPIPLKGELAGRWYRISLENIKKASRYF